MMKSDKNRSFFSFILLLTLATSACSTSPKRRIYTPGQSTDDSTTAIHSPNADALKKIQNLYLNGQHDQALNLIELTAEEKIRLSDRAEFWNLKGLCLLAKKNPVAAEAAFDRSIKENRIPVYAGYFQYNLANALYEQKKFPETARVLKKIQLSQLDSEHQIKVKSLIARIVQVNPGLMVVTAEDQTLEGTVAPNDVTNQPSGDSAAPSTSGGSNYEPIMASNAPQFETVIPDPGQTYSGPVNAKRIGLLLPLSGRYESFGYRAKRAIELAFSQTETGQSVELVAEDAGETLASQLEALKKLVEVHHAVGIIGPLLGKDLISIAGLASQYQVPLVSIAAVQGVSGSHLFSCALSNRDQVKRILDYAMKDRGMKKFAVIAPKNKAGEELAHLFWTEVEARRGTIKGFEFYQPSDTDFREPVDKVLGLYYTDARQSEVDELEKKRKELNITRKTMKTAQYFNLSPLIEFDAVFIPDEAKTVGQLIPTFTYRDADKINFLGISSWNSQQIIQRAQANVEGAVFPVSYNTIDPGKPTKEFNERFRLAYDANPGEMEAIAYDAAQWVIKAWASGASDREAFRLSLEQSDTIEGATGTLNVNEHRCNRNLNLFIVERGKFKSFD
jgi:ABC-type branched-subunit amino acid transport system substrate-binding protein